MSYCFKCGAPLENHKHEPWVDYYKCLKCELLFEEAHQDMMSGCIARSVVSVLVRGNEYDLAFPNKEA